MGTPLCSGGYGLGPHSYGPTVPADDDLIVCTHFDRLPVDYPLGFRIDHRMQKLFPVRTVAVGRGGGSNATACPRGWISAASAPLRGVPCRSSATIQRWRPTPVLSAVGIRMPRKKTCEFNIALQQRSAPRLQPAHTFLRRAAATPRRFPWPSLPPACGTLPQFGCGGRFQSKQMISIKGRRHSIRQSRIPHAGTARPRRTVRMIHCPSSLSLCRPPQTTVFPPLPPMVRPRSVPLR